MNTIFFDWYDFEDVIKAKFNVSFPENVKYEKGTFSIDLARGYENISIFVSSNIKNNELAILKDNGCKKILLRSAGFNMLDVEYAKEIGISVSRVASYSPESIAEFAFSLILSLARRMNVQRRDHRDKNKGITVESMGVLLKGKTLGLYGYGKIGRETARIARNGFGMKVAYFDAYYNVESEDMRVYSLDSLVKISDVLSVHVPLTNETKDSVNENTLKNAKNPLILINTSRGGILKNDDIIKLHKNGVISHISVDVWGDSDEWDNNLLGDNSN
ncbi:MAG: 2-hydroxyacid dehydrogenase [Candidatus Dojkabacteria bacterium]|nr:2-hydroxyacid dehydrogenase [Candidatus Dojkabacteria bacterium]MDQ7020800.1 2-hydroxyacid dehydrogenase [Candidatus Dojkabacteria bacterium]